MKKKNTTIYNRHNLLMPKNTFNKKTIKSIMKTTKIFFVGHEIRSELMDRNYLFLYRNN